MNFRVFQDNVTISAFTHDGDFMFYITSYESDYPHSNWYELLNDSDILVRPDKHTIEIFKYTTP
jgi:hypothetical protein